MQNITHQFKSKLFKNKAAIFALFFICFIFIVAVFAYFIAPDNSSNANRMIPEIGSKKPGFSIYLYREKSNSLSNNNFFNTLLFGKNDNYKYTPITGFKILNDSLYLNKYVDAGIMENVIIPMSSFNLSKQAYQTFINQHITKHIFLLGTDKFGRDILSRLIVGARISLSVGFIAAIISLTIGVFLGAIAGYFKGFTDDIIMWLINVIWSIPALLLVFAITLVLGKGFWQVFIAVGLTMWVNVARLVRGQVLAAKELEYVEAAKVLGYSNFRIIFKHILPNILGPILVITAANLAGAIVIESGLSFLGIGVQPPQPSWGLMIKDHYNFIVTNNAILALIPGIAIMLLVLAFNILGNGLRDAMNVKNT